MEARDTQEGHKHSFLFSSFPTGRKDLELPFLATVETTAGGLRHPGHREPLLGYVQFGPARGDQRTAGCVANSLRAQHYPTLTRGAQSAHLTGVVKGNSSLITTPAGRREGFTGLRICRELDPVPSSATIFLDVTITPNTGTQHRAGHGGRQPPPLLKGTSPAWVLPSVAQVAAHQSSTTTHSGLRDPMTPRAAAASGIPAVLAPKRKGKRLRRRGHSGTAVSDHSPLTSVFTAGVHGIKHFKQRV